MNTTAQRSSILHISLFFGFATSIVIWVLAYVLHMLPLHNAPTIVFIALVYAQYQGARLSGIDPGPHKRWKIGLTAGLVTGLINLLALGSLLADQRANTPNSAHPALTAIGYLVFSGVIGLVAGFLPMSSRFRVARSTTESNWLGRFAILAAVAGFSLLIAGGIVTSSGSGLAVPDWPSSFGANMFLFPLSKMTGGVFIEHAHRLLGVLVGLTTAALLIWTLMAKVRLTAKALALLVAALVIAQAVLGGIRVTNTNTALAMVHGVTGQVFVALLALLAARLSTTWRSDRTPTLHPLAAAQRKLNAIALSALAVQIILGAAVRHFDLQQHALMSHIGWSVVTMILLLAAGTRAQKKLGEERVLLRLGTATKHTVLLQMTLGVVALGAAMIFHDKHPAPGPYVALRTAHQVVGSLLLIIVTLLTAWTIRLTKPAP